MLKSAPESYTLDKFALGLDWASPPDKLSPMSVYDAKNINLTSYQALEKRGGITKLYADAYVSGQKILDIFEYVGPDTAKVLVASNTASASKVGYNNGGAWFDLKTGLTKDARFYFSVHNEYCFITNGEDDNFKIRESDVTAVGIAPPSAAPGVIAGDGTGLTGTYEYVYCYLREGGIVPEHRSNPSPASAGVVVANKDIDITYIASADPQVDKIEIYRSLDLTSSDDTSMYFLATTVANGSGTYTDAAADDDLTTLALYTNAAPPKAKFCRLHKDRMIYAHCPDEVAGKSLFMFSEIGRPESCPSANYQYFDRSDGQEITGLAALPDYLIVFKKNKIAALEGDFNQWYTISATTGCIAPWSIVTFQDQVMFLSGEGWKVTDGRSVMDVSKRLIAVNRTNYISWTERKNYSAVYNPARKQALFLMNHDSYTKIMMVGHVLSSLYADVSKENTLDAPYIGWTYHEYESHELSALGSYSDENGIERVLSGDTSGYIYLIDNGYQDDGNDISWRIETGWSTLGMPPHINKTVRFLNVVYSSDVGDSTVGDPAGTTKFYVDVDFNTGIDEVELAYGGGTYCGTAYVGIAYPGSVGTVTEILPLNDSCEGRKFKFRADDTSGNQFILMAITPIFRISRLQEGI